MGRNERIEIIKQIETKRKSRVFCYLTSDRPGLNVQVQKDILPIFVNLLGVNTTYDKVDVLIFTQGGDTLAAFGLSRLLREHSENVNALIPEKCYSAGTLFALGANEVIMTSGATLSPIDPSIVRPLNPAVQTMPGQPAQLLPLSVESVAGYKALVTDEWHLEGDALATAFKTLTDKVHPLALGDVYRVRQQIHHLATELLRQHRSDKEKIKSIVDTLAKKLGSHDYLIYRNEAAKILGKQVKRDDSVEKLIWNLYLDYVNEMQLGQPYDLNSLMRPTANNPNQRTGRVDLNLVTIESRDSGYVAKKGSTVTETTTVVQTGQIIKTIQETDISSGWIKYS